MMDESLVQLAKIMIEGLHLEDLAPTDIDPHAPLFGAGLGLDSIDALELAVIVDRRFGVKIGDAQTGRMAFASLTALRDYIATTATPAEG